MKIRIATPKDAPGVSSLISASAHRFMVRPDGLGAERFLESVAPQAIASYISNPSFHYVVAVCNSNVVGAAALRDGTHIFHLFVSPPMQGLGLGRALWSTLKGIAASNTDTLTVNASPNAVAIYERFGFEATGPRTEVGGIYYVPMTARIEPIET